MHLRPALPLGPGRRLLPNSWAVSQTGLWSGRTPMSHSLHTPRPGAGESQSVEHPLPPSLSPCAAGPGSHSRRPCGTSSVMPRHRISSAPSRDGPWHGARPRGTCVKHVPLAARSGLRYPGTRQGPPPSPPRPALSPRFDPARTRGLAPQGCRTTGGLPIVAPRHQLRPRASCPCGSSGHSWA